MYSNNLIPTHVHLNSNKTINYNASSASVKKNLTGSSYIEKICQFFISHYQQGELYMEYLKGACESEDGSQCTHCSTTPWRGPVINRIPRPVPDHGKLPSFHYKSVHDLSETETNPTHETDDYMTRGCVKLLKLEKFL